MLRVPLRRIRRFFALLPLEYRPAAADRPPMRELQRLHNRLVLHERPQPWRSLLRASARAAWPLWSSWLALRLSYRIGNYVRAKTGPGRARQFREMMRLAREHRWHPRDYYYFNFWRRSPYSPGDYLTDGRAQRLFLALNRGADLSVLDDKQRFREFCRSHGFASAPLLFAFADGRMTPLECDAAPTQDLFFKPRRGSQARGAARWLYNRATDRYRESANGRELTWTELSDQYSRRSETHEYLVQPRLFDHPEIADLGNGSLSTVRMITVVDRNGSVREFASMFNLPTRAALINNLSDGGLASPVDSATGILQVGFSGALGKPLFTNNPFNGARIAGRVLPRWRETIDLACAAHAQLTHIPVIGWDIALTSDGPLLLEGNHQIALNFHQLPPNLPLGLTEFPALLLHHLQQRRVAKHH